MDLLEVKSRIAEALVESIFRRARYDVAPFRASASPLRFGREDFSPDFRVSQASPEGGDREYLIEVKYRPSVEQFISVENQRGERSIFLLARRQWPALYFILVTERPGARPLLLPGRRLRDPPHRRALPHRRPHRGQGIWAVPA